jgi:hypothetical protein
MSKLGRRESNTILAIAIVAGVAAWLTAADLGTKAQHRGFVDFFSATAAVIGALLVALAIEARAVLPLKSYALVAPTCLAIGEIAAVAALSPSLPGGTYRWLLAFAVGGGLGGLIAVLWAAGKLLRSEVQAARVDALLEAGARALEDKRQREEASAARRATETES